MPPAPGNRDVDIDILNVGHEPLESGDEGSDPDLQKKLQDWNLVFYAVVKRIVEQEHEQFSRENHLESSSSAEIELHQHDTRTTILALVGRQLALNMVNGQAKDAFVEGKIRAEAKRLFAALKPYVVEQAETNGETQMPIDENHPDFGAGVRYHINYVNRARAARLQKLRQRQQED